MNKKILDFCYKDYTTLDIYNFLLDERDISLFPIMLALTKENTKSRVLGKAINYCLSNDWELSSDEINYIFNHTDIDFKLSMLIDDFSEVLEPESIINALNSVYNSQTINYKYLLSFNESQMVHVKENINTGKYVFCVFDKLSLLSISDDDFLKILPYISSKYLENLHSPHMVYVPSQEIFKDKRYPYSKVKNIKIRKHIKSLPKVCAILKYTNTYTDSEILNKLSPYINIQEYQDDVDFLKETDELLNKKE